MLKEIKPIQIYLPVKAHTMLKIIAAKETTTISEIIRELVTNYLDLNVENTTKTL